MIYTYTVFRAQDGYAWDEQAPDSFSEITQLLQQCENISHIYYIFHRGNVLRVQKAESPDAKERPFFVYTVDDFRNEDGVFSQDTRNKAWHQVAENFLTDCPPFHLTEFTEEQVPGILQSFARHLPEKLISGLVIDEDTRKNFRFFDTSPRKIIRDTESLRFVRKLPVFTEYNRLFRALCFHADVPAFSMLEFIALLSANLPAEAGENTESFRKLYEKYFDNCMIQKSVEYLLLSADEAFIEEVRNKLDSGISPCFGIDSTFVRYMTAWYISEYGIHQIEELRLFLHLFSCYGISPELLLPVLELWEAEFDPSAEPPFLKKTEVLTYSEFVRTVRKNAGSYFITEDISYDTIDEIYRYIREKEIPVRILENLFQENQKDKKIADLLEFLSFQEHPSKKIRHPEKNLLPAALFWSELVTQEELTAFYTSEETAEQLKKDAYEVRIPARVRNQPEISRNLLLAEKLSEKYRLNTLFQKGRLGKTEKTVLAVSGISFLLMLISCIRLVLVMLYEC